MVLTTVLKQSFKCFYLCCVTEPLQLAEGDPEDDDLLGAGAALEETDGELQVVTSRCALFEVCAAACTDWHHMRLPLVVPFSK